MEGLVPSCWWVCEQEGQCEDVQVQVHASVRVSESVSSSEKKRMCVAALLPGSLACIEPGTRRRKDTSEMQPEGTF